MINGINYVARDTRTMLHLLSTYAFIDSTISSLTHLQIQVINITDFQKHALIDQSNCDNDR